MNTDPPEDTEAQLRWLIEQAEKSYSDLYEATSASAATASYSDAKEFLYDAIGLARRLGKTAEAQRLSERLAHIKAVFRSQFSS
jgi:hypothetical protein